MNHTLPNERAIDHKHQLRPCRGIFKDAVKLRSLNIDKSLDNEFKSKTPKRFFNAFSGIRVPRVFKGGL